MSNDTVIPPHEFIGRADTLRPPPPSPPSPWVDAPTHDGLWWVAGEGEGADIALFQLTHYANNIWRIVGFSFETLEALHPAWRFAPAIPPEAP